MDAKDARTAQRTIVMVTMRSKDRRNNLSRNSRRSIGRTSRDRIGYRMSSRIEDTVRKIRALYERT